VVSEELRYATLGKISVSNNGPVGEESPFGGEAIPLIATIYRKSAIWGMHGPAWKKQPELNSFSITAMTFLGCRRRIGTAVYEFYYGLWCLVSGPLPNIEAYLPTEIDGDQPRRQFEDRSGLEERSICGDSRWRRSGA